MKAVELGYDDLIDFIALQMADKVPLDILGHFFGFFYKFLHVIFTKLSVPKIVDGLDFLKGLLFANSNKTGV